MHHITRYIALAIAVAAVSVDGSLDHADAADGRHLPKVAYGPPPAPPAVPLPFWCDPGAPCATCGCETPWSCSRPVSGTPCQWRAQAIARYEDAWCRYHGPRGSPVYVQCRANFDYEHASLPLRAIK